MLAPLKQSPKGESSRFGTFDAARRSCGGQRSVFYRPITAPSEAANVPKMARIACRRHGTDAGVKRTLVAARADTREPGPTPPARCSQTTPGMPHNGNAITVDTPGTISQRQGGKYCDAGVVG